jgi:hypothetical protein
MQNPVQQASDALGEIVASHDGEVSGAAVERGLVPTSEAARVLGVSEATLLRRARELGGKRGPRGRWLFELERLRVVREDGGAPPRSKTDRARDVGALAAKVFAMLRSKAAPDEIVERLEADPATVRGLCEEWAKCRSLGTRLFAEPPPALPAIPAWDHVPNATWTCCPQHQALHQEIESDKR